MDKPRAAIVVQHHLRFALKPDYVPIARQHAIAGPNGFAGEEHLGCLHGPAVLVIRMDLLIPTNGILQPFVAGESQRDFNVRTDVGLPYALIQVGSEDHGRNLLHQRSVSGFDVRRGFGTRGPAGRIFVGRDSPGQLGQYRLRLRNLRIFVEERAQRAAS